MEILWNSDFNEGSSDELLNEASISINAELLLQRVQLCMDEDKTLCPFPRASIYERLICSINTFQ